MITSTHIIDVSANVNVQQLAIPTDEDDITWIHACLIISAVFVFFIGWVGICCFIYSQKRKSTEGGESGTKTQAKSSINHLTVIGQKSKLTIDDNAERREGSQSGYHSQSALDAIEIGMHDEHSMTQHHNAKFLNIVKTSDIFEGNGYSMDIGSKISCKLSRRTTETYCVNGVPLSDVDLSETLDSETDMDTDSYAVHTETDTSHDTNCHLVVMANGDVRKDSHSIDI